MNWGGRLLAEVAQDPADETWTDPDFPAYLDASAKGDHAEALEHIESTVERLPDHGPAFFAKAHTLGELNRLDEAILTYQQAIRFKPDYVEAWNNLGVAYGKRRKFAEEIHAYEQAIRFKPDYLEAWSNLAEAHTLLKHYDKAWDAVRHLEKLDLGRASRLAGALRILARQT